MPAGIPPPMPPPPAPKIAPLPPPKPPPPTPPPPKLPDDPAAAAAAFIPAIIWNMAGMLAIAAPGGMLPWKPGMFGKFAIVRSRSLRPSRISTPCKGGLRLYPARSSSRLSRPPRPPLSYPPLSLSLPRSYPPLSSVFRRLFRSSLIGVRPLRLDLPSSSSSSELLLFSRRLLFPVSSARSSPSSVA